jgi:hypothetical protein
MRDRHEPHTYALLRQPAAPDYYATTTAFDDWQIGLKIICLGLAQPMWEAMGEAQTYPPCHVSPYPIGHTLHTLPSHEMQMDEPD